MEDPSKQVRKPKGRPSKKKRLKISKAKRDTVEELRQEDRLVTLAAREEYERRYGPMSPSDEGESDSGKHSSSDSARQQSTSRSPERQQSTSRSPERQQSTSSSPQSTTPLTEGHPLNAEAILDAAAKKYKGSVYEKIVKVVVDLVQGDDGKEAIEKYARKHIPVFLLTGDGDAAKSKKRKRGEEEKDDEDYKDDDEDKDGGEDKDGEKEKDKETPESQKNGGGGKPDKISLAGINAKFSTQEMENHIQLTWDECYNKRRDILSDEANRTVKKLFDGYVAARKDDAIVESFKKALDATAGSSIPKTEDELKQGVKGVMDYTSQIPLLDNLAHAAIAILDLEKSIKFSEYKGVVKNVKNYRGFLQKLRIIFGGNKTLNLAGLGFDAIGCNELWSIVTNAANSMEIFVGIGICEKWVKEKKMEMRGNLHKYIIGAGGFEWGKHDLDVPLKKSKSKENAKSKKGKGPAVS